jgi:hypothetical protein
VTFYSGPIPGKDPDQEGYTNPDTREVHVSLSAIEYHTKSHRVMADGRPEIINPLPFLHGNTSVEEGAVTLAHERGHNTSGPGHGIENPVADQNTWLMQKEVEKMRPRNVKSRYGDRGIPFPANRKGGNR